MSNYESAHGEVLIPAKQWQQLRDRFIERHGDLQAPKLKPSDEAEELVPATLRRWSKGVTSEHPAEVIHEWGDEVLLYFCEELHLVSLEIAEDNRAVCGAEDGAVLPALIQVLGEIDRWPKGTGGVVYYRGEDNCGEPFAYTVFAYWGDLGRRVLRAREAYCKATGE